MVVGIGFVDSVCQCPIIIFMKGDVSLSHLFSLTPSVKVQRSAFDRSHTYKTTFNAGRLIPFFCDEVLPGDTFNLKASLFCRMATPIVPVMDNLYLETFFFFVPNRLVWDNWQKFMGEQENPGDSIDYLVPTGSFATAQARAQSVADYFGLPLNKQGFSFNALPFRGYYLIWNEFFRDQNLQDSIAINKGDSGIYPSGGVGTGTDYIENGFRKHWIADSCLPRGKRHDYFTSCLPSPQKFEALRIPLTGNAPVLGNGKVLGFTDGTGSSAKFGGLSDDTIHGTAVNFFTGLFGQDLGTTGYAATSFNSNAGVGVPTKAQLSVEGKSLEDSGLYADLSQVTAATINDLRTAFQIQRLLESQNRSGTRYKELLLGCFGVNNGDARLQRPEYLGGSSCRINVNPVMQTSSTNDTTPQGNLAAYAVAADRVNGFVKSFTEHGYIIGLVNVRADLNYQQGLNRMWSRRTRYDFYWPTLAHLGEQAVLNKEIYLQGSSVVDDNGAPVDDGVFGYQERWAEYRYFPNMITGKMRSTYDQSLDIWHLAQKFDSLPTLSNEFIQDNPPVDRVVAVTSEPQFLLDVYFKMKCVRPMPVYSIPGLIDHF